MGPFETRTFIHGVFIQQYIQVAICTLLVYDLCEYKNYLMTPFSSTFITVITYDKEVSTITNV